MDWKKYSPHIISVVVILLTSILYCSPVLQGKRLVQDDIVKNIAQTKEMREYRDANGEEPLWTTRVFSGMTAFHIGTQYSTNVALLLDKVVRRTFPRTANVLFVTMLGFFILLVAMGVNPWLALAASLTYGISTNLIVSLVAGHVTKVVSIGYMAPAVGGVVLALGRKRLIGALMTLVFVGLMINGNHFQILYYFLLISIVVGIVHLIQAFKEKTLPDFAKAVGILALAAIGGLLPNTAKLYNAYEHSQETIRGGKSELSSKDDKDKGGLDRDYAMRWSYGPLETMTLVVPSFMGGGTGEPLPEGGNVEEALKSFQLNKQQKEGILAQGPMYVGDQPFLLGTVYFGAGFIFLFILSIFLLKGPTRTWLLSIIVMSLVISWGRHFEAVTGLLFDYFPLYNKFRTPSMALAIAGLAIPLMGILGLHRVLNGDVDKTELKKALKYTVYIAGGLMLLLFLYGLLNDWVGPKDASYQGKNSPWGIDAIYEALLADRKSRYLSDWFISTLVMAVTAFVIWYHDKGKMKLTAVVMIIGLVYLADMWHVSKRYLNNDDFVSQRDFDQKFRPSLADQAILQDPDPHYRVINVTRSPWTDGLTCYHHENVGGHHAAKLQRYQDLIENELNAQLQKLNSGLMQQGDQVIMNPSVAQQMPVYNMLNTKYFIVQANNPGGAVLNRSACGNAWFVENIQKVGTADEEMAALAQFDPNKTAIVSAEYEASLYGYNFGKSTNASIQLTDLSPKFLKYTSKNDQDGLGVFSEVYYGNGWEATIDGEPAEIERVNYVLRAIKIPSGEHVVEMRFNPSSFRLGMNVSLAGSVLFLLFAGGLIYFHLKKQRED
ncbi:MAG: YfhO family protein [Flavobacteriales bacterium]|nr:YfhO family protein [Flavobacteriales bacterium]